MLLTVNDAKMKHTKDLLHETAGTFFDIREHITEGQYVSTMNAISELEKRLKKSEDARRLLFYTQYHPMSVDDINVESGQEVTSDSSVLVIDGRNMTPDQAKERMVMDLMSLGRWRQWFEASLKKVKPIRRFTEKTKLRAYDMICLQDNIDRSSVTTYESIRRQSHRLREIDEKTFRNNFKHAYNMRVDRKTRELKRFVELFKFKEEALKKMLVM